MKEKISINSSKKSKTNAKAQENSFVDVDLSDAQSLQNLANSVNESDNHVLVKVFDKDTMNFSYGVALPNNHPNAMDYLREIKDYSSYEKDIYKQIDICRKLYTYEGIVGTAIDILVDLSFSDIKVYNTKNKKAKTLIDHWLENVNSVNFNISKGINPLNRSIAFEYYLTSNVFLYSKWSNVSVPDLSGKYRLPMSVMALDPKIIEIPQESVQFGGKTLRLNISKIFGTSLMSSQEEKNFKQSLPLKLRNSLSKNGSYIDLDHYNVYHIKRRGSMYAGWGVPYLARSFSSIASKRKLRTLDDSTIDGMINSITIFKIGDKDIPKTWEPARLNAFANLIKSPEASVTAVWGFDVDFIHISPSGEVLNFADRYKDCNTDIAHALGIPMSIITGSGEKAGDVWASILFLIERLEAFREEYKAFVEDNLTKIMDENGLSKEKPKVRFIKPKINKEDVKNIILAYYDRGLLSKESALEEIGVSIEEEIIRREQEKANKVDKILERPEVPFSPKAGGKPGGTPNPQTINSPKKKSTKKETKITNVNQKTKKASPRIDGSEENLEETSCEERIEKLALSCWSNERIDGLCVESAFGSIDHIYDIDENGASEFFGKDRESVKSIINKALLASANESEILENIKFYYQKEDLKSAE